MVIKSSPRVTVVIPVYNRAQYVREAIDSILRQTYSDFELLLIDDGSTDGTGEVLRSYADERVRLVSHQSNLGIPRTRNEGVRLARGDYVAFLDSDDVAYSTRLERQVAFLDTHPDFAAVGAWVSWMDGTGRPISRVKRKPVSSREIAALRLLRSGVENSASMGRTTILRNYPHNEGCDVVSDFELWARIATRHKLSNLPEVLVRRRLHGGQITKLKAEAIGLVRQAIYADQLARLDVAFTPKDLERHGKLRGMQKRNFTPDRSYVDWAERWLIRLHEANNRTLSYPEPEFSVLLGKLWFRVCWHAQRNVGWAVWPQFVTPALLLRG
jgi:glycosyltransferase involved in cell wall biosynthesis